MQCFAGSTKVRIFVGYHYGPSDVWVENYVYRLIEAFGDRVENGKHLYLASNLSQGIIDKIHACDALIGIASRRNLQANGQYTTHPWVRDELAVARGASKLFLQLREVGLDSHLGILEGAQYIEFDPSDLKECLVRLTEAIGQWHSMLNVSLHLIPNDFRVAVESVMRLPGFYCNYLLYDAHYEKRNGGTTVIVPKAGGLHVMLRNVPRDYFIQLQAGHGKLRWESELVSVDSPAIHMSLV